MAGRPRKPAQQKIIQGTFRKSRNPKNEAQFTGLREMPPAPESFNKYAKYLWDKLGGELIKSGVMTEPDIIAFEMLCVIYGRCKTYEAHISKSPLKSIEGKMGGRSAIAQQYNADLSACIKLMEQFGLTPSSRNRFGVSKKKETDPDTEKMKELLGA